MSDKQITKRESDLWQLLQGWRIQARTIHALIIRDLMMRYGRDNIGFAWVVLEPMILTAGVMSIMQFMGKDKEGLKVIEIILTGYMPLTLWRHLTGPVVNMFRSNVAMLYHRQITLLDIVAARQILEIIGTSAALLIVYGSLSLANIVAPIQHLDMFLLGWMMMAWIGGAFGTILAVLTERYEVAERFVQPIQYLNIPIAGTFFLVDWMPHWAQQLLLYHPLVHCYEVFRTGYFGDAIVTHYNLWYFSAVTFCFTFLGLWGLGRIRAHVRLN